MSMFDITHASTFLPEQIVFEREVVCFQSTMSQKDMATEHRPEVIYETLRRPRNDVIDFVAQLLLNTRPAEAEERAPETTEERDTYLIGWIEKPIWTPWAAWLSESIFGFLTLFIPTGLMYRNIREQYTTTIQKSTTVRHFRSYSVDPNFTRTPPGMHYIKLTVQPEGRTVVDPESYNVFHDTYLESLRYTRPFDETN